MPRVLHLYMPRVKQTRLSSVLHYEPSISLTKVQKADFSLTIMLYTMLQYMIHNSHDCDDFSMHKIKIITNFMILNQNHQ